jgi:glycerol-3-phosphate dehydrogenase (NAD(P)+)
MRVAVIGAGSWGTALAWLLGQKGLSVLLWGRDAEQIACIAAERVNRRYLPEARLPETVVPTTETAPLQACAVWVLAVPSGALREALRLCPPPDATLIIAAKGLEPDTGKLLTQVVCEALGNREARTAVLSGPNLAVELVRGAPTASVAASRSLACAEQVQELLMTPPILRVYTSDDVVGVELGGALKNVYAIGAGISDGLGFGDNTKATLLTRGLAEMMRFGAAMGARPETFMGLTGVGDLFATAVSRLSRNYRFGRAIAEGKTVDEARALLGQVAEGYPTALAAQTLAAQLGVEMPLLHAIADILTGKRARSRRAAGLDGAPAQGRA